MEGLVDSEKSPPSKGESGAPREAVAATQKHQDGQSVHHCAESEDDCAFTWIDRRAPPFLS